MSENDVNSKDTSAPEVKGDDLIKNLKSEMDRKLTNFQETLRSTTEALTAKLETLAPARVPAAPTKKSFRDKFYEDEDAAVEDLKAEIRQEMMGTLDERSRHTETISRLYNEFPELADGEAPLTKEAVKIFKNLSKDEQKNPNAYRVAVLEAATELGVQPMKKRKPKETDDFTGGSGQGGSSKRNAVASDTLEFARAMGLDVEDPKVVDRLKTHSKRSYSTYR